MKSRLDQALVERGLIATRSQAESYIGLSKVMVNKKVVTKPAALVSKLDDIKLITREQYVSRAGFKLASIAGQLGLDFKDKVILDVGSSTGGFTDYALQHGAKKVIAVDVGTNQLHPSLLGDKRIELHDKTDIRNMHELSSPVDVVLIDVSFISLRDILPSVVKLSGPNTIIVAMVKPQFEAGESGQKHKGVIKNDSIRRKILQDYESWVKGLFVIIDKADSDVAGAKGNRERFYLMQIVK